MSATNSYTDMAELIRDYMRQPIANYLNQSISINSVTLSCDVYRIADGTSLTSSVFTGCVANDANTQIIVGRNLKVASGVTLRPPYRCKGVFIGSPGVFTNSGTISMTARGASGAGKNIKLVDNYQISATGGSGGAGVNGQKVGNTGSSPSSGVLSCAGGGSGGYSRNNTSYTSGAGGSGSSFSGGAGGSGTEGNHNGNAGSSTGGAGGNSPSHVSGQSDDMGGGAGNPGGNGGGSGGSIAGNKGSDGTGGLLVIMANTLNQSGALEAKGAKGGDAPGDYAWKAGGGGSGGGCIVLLSYSSTVTGTNSVAGGAGGDAGAQVGSGSSKNGGAGGTGVYSNLTVLDMILSDPYPLSLALTMEDFLEDIDPESGRLLALMDNDELMYEYNGTRHRAVRTDVDFTDFTPPTGRVPSGHGVPVGTTITFFGDTAPDGYLLMDGTEYLIADYPVLANHLLNMTTGSQYEGTDSSHFKVPNVLGEFPRFSGTNAHTNQGSGSTVGTHQDATAVDGNYQNVTDKVLRVGQTSAWNGGNRNGDSDLTVEGFTQYFTSSAQTINESNYTLQTVRPTNTSFLPCIKY